MIKEISKDKAGTPEKRRKYERTTKDKQRTKEIKENRIHLWLEDEVLHFKQKAKAE